MTGFSNGAASAGVMGSAQKGLVNNALYYEVKMPLLVRFMDRMKAGTTRRGR